MGTALMLTMIIRVIAAQILSSARGLVSRDKAVDKIWRICGKFLQRNTKQYFKLNCKWSASIKSIILTERAIHDRGGQVLPIQTRNYSALRYPNHASEWWRSCRDAVQTVPKRHPVVPCKPPGHRHWKTFRQSCNASSTNEIINEIN